MTGRHWISERYDTSRIRVAAVITPLIRVAAEISPLIRVAAAITPLPDSQSESARPCQAISEPNLNSHGHHCKLTWRAATLISRMKPIGCEGAELSCPRVPERRSPGTGTRARATWSAQRGKRRRSKAPHTAPCLPRTCRSGECHRTPGGGMRSSQRQHQKRLGHTRSRAARGVQALGPRR